MSRQLRSENMGPLPRADRNSELQRLSIVAFQKALLTDRFIFRDERAEDFGVDGELELLVDGFATNLRGKVQLKAMESSQINSDGSISLSVAPSNLNYLLSGPCPLYVLYIHATQELRLLWAIQEYHRITASTPDWPAQGTVTLRFERVLNPETLNEIYETIRREGRFRRDTLDILARATAASPDVPVTVIFDPNTLAATDPKEVCKTLAEMGMALVSVGRGAEVIDLFDHIAPSATRTAQLQAVRAYANFSLGRYAVSQAAVTEALLIATQGKPLDKNIRQHLLYIKLACEYQSGVINTAGYNNAIKDWEAAGEQEGSWYVLAHKLNALRYGYLEEASEERRANLLGELKVVVAQIESLPGASERFLVNARLALLYVEGAGLVTEYFKVMSSVSLSALMGFSPETARLTSFLNERIRPWETQIGAIVERARQNGNPLTYADALLVRASIRLPQVATASLSDRLGPRRDGTTFAEVTVPVLQNMETEISHSQKLFHDASSLEGELQAQALLADLLVLSGRTEEAQEHARTILPQAEALGYTKLIQRAREHIAGNSPLKLPEADLQTRLAQDQDLTAASMTDEQIKDLAQWLVEVVHLLPSERIPIAEKELMLQRREAHERFAFCRHLNLLQNLTHTKHPSTHYRTDPGYVCRCNLYNLQSAFEDTNGDAQIERFKAACCLGCKSREPKHN